MALASGSLSSRLASLHARLLETSRCEVFEYKPLLFTECDPFRPEDLGDPLLEEFRGAGLTSVKTARGDEALRVVSSDLRSGRVLWSPVNASFRDALVTVFSSRPELLSGFGVRVHAVTALKDGWLATRSSTKAAAPGLWGHACSIDVTPSMLDRDDPECFFDPCSLVAGSLSLEVGLTEEHCTFHPWLVQRSGSRGGAHHVYVLVDARSVGFDQLTRLRRRAPAAYVTDGVAVVASSAEWRGRRGSPWLVLPSSSPRNVLRSVGS